MRLLVTGKNGQVARSLATLNGTGGAEIVTLGRPDLDIVDGQSVARAIAGTKPDLVVNAAAYTAVDRAEEERDLAFSVNRDGAANVAGASAAAGLPVFHLSTDYVFAGDKSGPYVETDPTGPASVYGQSKLAGEQAVAAANPKHLILRTAWVYSPHGNNFVKTMLRLAAGRDEIPVVADQWGNPTSAADIASAIVHAAELVVSGKVREWAGICHLCGTGETNWAGFARHIFAVSARMGGPSAAVRDIGTADYPTPAPRPANSRLSGELFAKKFGWRMPDWRKSARIAVEALQSASNSF